MAFPYKSKIFPRGLIRRNSPCRFFPRTVLDIQITSYMLIHIIVQLNPKTLFLYNRIFLWIIQGLFPNVDFSHENIFYHKHFGTKILLFPKILYTRWEIISFEGIDKILQPLTRILCIFYVATKLSSWVRWLSCRFFSYQKCM